MLLAFHHITFAYDGAISSLLEDVTAHFPLGWTGIVGPNGAGKTTLLHLAAGELHPQQGTIKRPEHIVFCPQRTDDAPALLPHFIADTEAEACVLRGKLRIGDDWAERWPTLSHGERKRAQIAVALWRQPDVLLIDEPTNHIDLAARALLAEALSAFRGIGLLVSHDRDLLDLLCRQCLFIDPPQATMRPGTYTEAAAEGRREEESQHAEREVLQGHLERLSAESHRRHGEASHADRKKSKRGLARGDRDGRAKIDAARISGKDGQAGRLANQLDGRLAQAQQRLASLEIKKRYAVNFWLDGSTSPRDRLFTLPAGSFDLDGARRLVFPELTMLRHDRIAITGANGLGKSTLIRHLLRGLTIPEDHLIYLPQEIDLAQTRDIMTAVHGLSHDQLGLVMTVVNDLGSRPERLLQHLDASPGELRKVLLALGVIRHPYLIIMDEPTNHLDLPAIESLEGALNACPCGLLLVSHDLRFLSHITHTRWHLQQEGEQVIVSMRDIGTG
ncbi:MAG TPA: ATP-binding cassette domain-containing protein [Armatimonadota bacterium]|jgi:ATPase subunit of ABC transporter with duplicated ATPase domains